VLGTGVGAKSMTVPQPAATRRRAKTLAAGGFFAAERSAVSTAKLKQTAFN
tara:strand:- start:6926 stop:7078 length:153 start_codon:yes stop_codon:yes gene_type:complete